MNTIEKIDRSILDEARAANSNEIVFAAAVLERNGQPDRIALYVDEYGDGDGERQIVEFISRCKRIKALTRGERLRAVRFTITDLPPEEQIEEQPKGEDVHESIRNK